MALGADAEDAGGIDQDMEPDVSKANKFRCRVDGCKRHLSREKTYFRRYRCCMSHSKQPAVLVEGQVRRWCQQCCCFHELAAFDGEKRNCRERLAMHNDRRNKRKNDPAATREPSSRVAHVSTAPSAATAALISAQQQFQQQQQQQQQQQPQHHQQGHRSGRGMSRDVGHGGKASRSLTSLQTALPGHGLRANSAGSPQHVGKRQRLADAPQLLQPDQASHGALLASMLAHGGIGGGLNPSRQMAGGLNPAALHPGLLQHGGMFNPAHGFSAPGVLNPAAAGLSGQQQAYQDALMAVSAVQSLQAQQDPVAAAAAAHRIASSQAASSRVAQLAGQLAAAQAAAGANAFAGAAAQLLSASSASAGGSGEGLRAPSGEAPPAAAAYLQALQAAQLQAARQQAAQQAHPGAGMLQGLRSASLGAGFPPQQQRSAPPNMGHLMAAGRELSLNSVYSQPGACAAQRPHSTGVSGGLQQQCSKPTASRRGSGLTEQLSDTSLWSRRSSNTAVDAGLFLPTAAPAPLAAAAAAADSSLRTASITTIARSTPPTRADVPATTTEQSGGLALDLATPVQGHYGAMRNTGAEGCTYLHAQLMQAHAAAKARSSAAKATQAPSLGAAGQGTMPHQKADWASIVQHAAAASGIRSALQSVEWKPTAELGSHIWWQRRLGALALLVRLGAAGAVPARQYTGLLALMEMSLRLARAAAISK